MTTTTTTTTHDVTLRTVAVLDAKLARNDDERVVIYWEMGDAVAKLLSDGVHKSENEIATGSGVAQRRVNRSHRVRKSFVSSSDAVRAFRASGKAFGAWLDSHDRADVAVAAPVKLTKSERIDRHAVKVQRDLADLSKAEAKAALLAAAERLGITL